MKKERVERMKEELATVEKTVAALPSTIGTLASEITELKSKNAFSRNLMRAFQEKRLLQLLELTHFEV